MATYELEGVKRELQLEQQAHRETRQQLARTQRAAQYWQCEARRLERGDTEPTPNPMPLLVMGAYVDSGGDDDGDDVMGLLLATLACLANLGTALTDPDHPTPEHLLRAMALLAQHRTARLAAALGARGGTGGGGQAC